MQNLNEIQIDLSLLPDNAKIELFNFYQILLDKYHDKSYDGEKGSIYSSEKKQDVLIGLFEGPPDLASRSEEININRSPLTVRRFRHSGLIGTWKDRDDIQDSSVYARRLREHVQSRRQD
jgi:hypothetical protein